MIFSSRKRNLPDETAQPREKVMDTKSYYVTLALSKEDTNYYCKKSPTFIVKDKDGKTLKLIAEMPSTKPPP